MIKSQDDKYYLEYKDDTGKWKKMMYSELSYSDVKNLITGDPNKISKSSYFNLMGTNKQRKLYESTFDNTSGKMYKFRYMRDGEEFEFDGSVSYIAGANYNIIGHIRIEGSVFNDD